MNIAEMNDAKLLDEIKGLHNVIYNMDCFGAEDVLAYEKISRELERRGYCNAWNEVWVRRNNHVKKNSFSLLSGLHG